MYISGNSILTEFMRLGVLFSGGKDSCMALHLASKKCEIACLITIISENDASFMFHTPNIGLAKQQAEAIGLPILIRKTKGEKEKELADLEAAIKAAKEKYKINGIVTGALASVYQSSRIEKICKKLKLECINPLWHKDQFWLLNEVVKSKFDVIVVGIFAEGLENFLGRKIDKSFIKDIKPICDKYKINPAGEGGEIETFVLRAPFFRKALKIEKSHVSGSGFSKTLVIDKLKII